MRFKMAGAFAWALSVALLSGVAWGTGSRDMGVIILQDLKDYVASLPTRLDYEFAYHSIIPGLSEAEALARQADFFAGIEEQISQLEPDDRYERRRDDLLHKRKVALEQLTNDRVLFQKKRVRWDGTQVRYEVLEDLGCPSDSPDSEDAAEQKRQRSGIWFAYGENMSVDYKPARNTAIILDSKVAYPNLVALMTPVYLRDLDDLLASEDVEITARRENGNVTVTVEFPPSDGSRHWDVTVNLDDGIRLLREEAYCDGELRQQRVYSDYRKVGSFLLPYHIETATVNGRQTVDLERIDIEPVFNPGVFDFHEALANGTRILDGRFDSPISYVFDAEVDVGSLLKTGESKDASSIRQNELDAKMVQATCNPQDSSGPAPGTGVLTSTRVKWGRRQFLYALGILLSGIGLLVAFWSWQSKRFGRYPSSGR